MFNSRKNGILTIQRAQYKRWCNNRRLSLNSLQNTTTIEDNNYTSNGRSFPLPPELLVEILSYLSSNQASLHSASLVCKQWLYCVAPILYSHPQINDTYRWAMFILTLTRERMSFFYGDLIRSIDLSSGKSIEAMKDHEFYRRLSNSNDEQLQQQQQQQQQPRRQNPRAPNEYLDAIGVPTDNAPALPRIVINNMHADVAARISYHPQHQQQQQQYELQQDILMKGLPFIIVSTSSLVQIAHTCKNITSLNLSYTSLLHDSLIAETGEYLSTLQRYAVQPGLTHIQIPIKQAIQAIGKECTQLQEVKIQRCEWVTAHVIWMFVYFCPNLKRLDARRSTKCTVKRLISTILEDPLSYLSNQHTTTTSYPLPATTTLHNSNSSSSSNHSGTLGADSSIVLPSSSSSSTVDVNNDFANLFNDTAVHNNNTIVFAEEEDDELEQQTAHDDDNVTFHFRFNEETGLYEQLEAPNQSRITLVRQLTEDMDENNNDGFWFAPFPPATDEFGARRPPSPLHTTMQRNAILNKSLKSIVYDIIMDAKELGAIDLNWLVDYQH